MTSRTVAIAGGGIIGLSIALELKARGHTVVVVDRGPFGNEASSAAGGMLAPQLESPGPGPFLELALRSRAIWPAYAEKVQQTSDRPVDYRACGVINAAFDENEFAHLEAEAAWQQAYGLRADLVDGVQAREVEPLLSPEAVGALLMPDDHVVDPQLFMPALVETARKAGVELRQAEVKGLRRQGDTATGLELSDGDSVAADWVINAMGAWATQLESFGLPKGAVIPVRGQMVQVRCDTQPKWVTTSKDRGYQLPRLRGQLVAGSTREEVGFESGTTAKGHSAILTGAIEVIPSLGRSFVTRSWSGFRPATTDDLPLIGEANVRQLIWATGHFRNGILLAPITARLVGGLVQGQGLPDWAAGVSAARLAQVT